MKLTEFTLENVLSVPNHRIGRLSDGVNIIEGQRGSGKTAIREFIREIVFGNSRYADPQSRATAYLPPRGEISVVTNANEYRLNRIWNETGRLQANTRSGGPIADVSPIENYLAQLNAELYDSVFNFSLPQALANFPRLSRVLNHQLRIPLGSSTVGSTLGSAVGSEDAYGKWCREAELRKSRVNSLEQHLDLLTRNRSDLLRQRDQQSSHKQSRLVDIERELAGIVQAIGQSSTLARRNRLATLEREINDVRMNIDELVRRESLTPATPDRSNLPDHYQLMYLRLDEIESQIRRWRRIQADVQAQRVRLKDEMVVWGELTLDSEDHPYHAARKILAALEEGVNQTDHHARQWEQAPAHRTDPSQSVQAIQILCQSMRHDLQALSHELGQQYKNIRHRAAAAELKQLRHCYNVMNENIERLVRRREQIIHEIRFLDPAGAEAIMRGEPGLLQCALHEGYFEARRRFVGPLAVRTETVVSPWKAELTEARNRLQMLQSEANQLQRLILEDEALLARLRSQQGELEAERSSLMGALQQGPETEIAQLETEINRTSAERDALWRQIQADGTFQPPVANSILTEAAALLSQLSGGELTRLWLSDSATGGVEVADRHNQSRSIGKLSLAQQNFVYLALVFAAKKDLAARGIDFPTLIDDVSVNFNREELAAAMRFFQRMQQEEHQLVLLTEHIYYGAETINFARFALPPRNSQTIPPSFEYVPEVVSRPISLASIPTTHATPTTPISSIGKTAASTEVLHHWIDAGDIDPITIRHLEVSPPEPWQELYPASKFAHPIESEDRIHDVNETPDYIVRYPGAPSASAAARYPAASSKPSVGIKRAVPVSVDTLIDPLAFAPSFDDATELDQVALFDLNRLRAFSDLGVHTVGQFLSLNPDDVPSGLRERGITGDQLNRWQAVIWLMANVSGLRINDAKILVACGVTEPEHLASSHPEQLVARIQRFLNSSEGQRFAVQSPGIDSLRVQGWLRALEASRPNWQRQGGLSRLARRRNSFRNGNPPQLFSSGSGSPHAPHAPHSAHSPHAVNQRAPVTSRPNDYDRGDRTDRRPNLESNPRVGQPVRADLRPERESRGPYEARPPRMQTPEPRIARAMPELPTESRGSTKPASSANLVATAQPSTATPAAPPRSQRNESVSNVDNKLRFYLELKDHVEAAPAIGPKTAERFERIGIHTVEDFLKQTAESMATKLKYRRITADLILAWQHQTRLVCRVPNLRGHDAQLLVACNFTEPEKIAAMNPQRLLDIILPFARSKEGLKIVRTGKEPDLQEVADWINWAGRTRSLHAA